MVEYAYKENGVLNLKPVAMSLSQSEIDEIATELLEAMQPDWQNAISLTAAQLQAGYTAPADGMIVGNGAGTSAVTELSVNNIIVAVGTYANGVYVRMNVSAIVKPGDIIKISANLNTVCQISFVPFMTSNPVSLRPLDPHKIDTAILNHWDDITSDCSTAGSSAGFVLDRAVYNPILRKLRVNFHITNSFAATNGKDFILTYNGSDLPAFTNSCIYTSSMIQTTTTAGFELSTWIQQANKVSFRIFNRSTSAWAAGSSFTTQIEF